MRSLMAFSIALTALVVLGSVSAGGDSDVQKETKKLQGRWRLLSTEEDGSKREFDTVDFVLTIKGVTFDVGALYTGTYKILEVKGKIRKSDVTYTAGDHLRGKTVPQLAEWLDEDTFRVCIPFPDGKGTELKRPTEFNAKKGSRQGICVFRRIKK